MAIIRTWWFYTTANTSEARWFLKGTINLYTVGPKLHRALTHLVWSIRSTSWAKTFSKGFFNQPNRSLTILWIETRRPLFKVHFFMLQTSVVALCLTGEILKKIARKFSTSLVFACFCSISSIFSFESDKFTTCCTEHVSLAIGRSSEAAVTNVCNCPFSKECLKPDEPTILLYPSSSYKFWL